MPDRNCQCAQSKLIGLILDKDSQEPLAGVSIFNSTAKTSSVSGLGWYFHAFAGVTWQAKARDCPLSVMYADES